ncbi:hypothetical protein DERF_010267 [Dermatophagoides farinae]|uniref:Uncharacterized protein n=1 Tax=Dermatophagoides farinae TaxID=6954 RepID=A0A922L4U8_DERFA|nr:hypothetical protein DERF_010267 [Dermatophagoides farinae]
MSDIITLEFVDVGDDDFTLFTVYELLVLRKPYKIDDEDMIYQNGKKKEEEKNFKTRKNSIKIKKLSFIHHYNINSCV